MYAEADAARGAHLGALLDVIIAALAAPPSTGGQSRMRTFEHWVMRAEPHLGWKAGTFSHVYAENRARARDVELEASLIALPLLDYLASDYVGQQLTMEDLLDHLKDRTSMDEWKQRGWPQGPLQLSNRLVQLAPTLRAAGWERVKHTREGSRRPYSFKKLKV